MRGMSGLKLVISDDHKGLRSALQAILPSVKWQRCLFHLAQNAGAHVPSTSMKKEASVVVRETYLALDRDEAEVRMRKVVERYKSKAAKFCEWLEEHFVEGLTFFAFPKDHWKKIRTNNLLERMNQEQKRRTRTVRLFPSVESCERLVITIAMRIHEEWSISKRYLRMDK